MIINPLCLGYLDQAAETASESVIMGSDSQIVDVATKLAVKVFGWASEPARKFVDGRIEEFNLVGMVKAENVAMLLDAAYDIPKGWIESTDPIKQRAGLRVLRETVREQRNIEDVVMEAIAVLSESSRPEDIDDDWCANFLGHARKVADPGVRILWSRLLAGEADNPGSFSKKTVNILADMDKSTAVSFTMLCKFVCRVDGMRKLFLVPNYQQPIFGSGGLDFYTLTALQALGLIEISAVGGFSHVSNSRYTTIEYFGSSMILESAGEVPVGQVSFTPFGSQLATLVQPQITPGFFDHLAVFYKQQTDISSVSISKSSGDVH
ncbi:MAG: DUF2806 domain-containing protein [Dehalococcoidia bacterium]|nr:DUF2806 domain-containing protein [Dehalococcoidia bacterium]